MFFLKIIAIAVISYLLGSLSFSIIASKSFGKGDLREKGSGNAGLTNAIRTGGTWVAVLTLVGDSMKGIAAVLLAKWAMCGESAPYAIMWGMYTAAVTVAVGHIFPVFFGFRGGKGVITSAAVLAVLDWRAFLAVMGVFIIVFAVSGIVSLASISAAVALPLSVLIFCVNDFPYSIAYMVFLAAIIIYGHRGNIRRLASGTEKRLLHKQRSE